MKWLILFLAISIQAQPVLPKPITFEWDFPPNMAYVVGWELQWGDSSLEKVQLPIYQTLYSPEVTPITLAGKASVSSVAPVGISNSIPTTIYYYNVIATLESSEDLQNWKTEKSVQWTDERGSNVFFRVKLQTTRE